MEEPRENQEQKPGKGISKKKVIWRTVGIVLSFYVVAVIVSGFVAEENFKMQFALLILPTIATIVYGYRVALKENYLALKTIFIVLAILETMKIAERIISGII